MMTTQENFFKRLFGELRNRRVFRVATVYLGVGFAFLEASDILVPSLGLPGITILVVLGILMIGFPIAVILAWHYQMTPEGLRRSPKSGEKQTAAQKPLTSNRIIITLLIFIALLLLYPKIFPDDPEPGSSEAAIQQVDPRSIAVLPFTSFTDEREDEIFADGMHDDILTQLSKIQALRVVSRTTMMKYKETEKSIGEIASEVGVANLLEGSVRRAGDQVRIVAQLIEAGTDEHLWAETYDRSYADIFAVQSDVARKIAGALQSTLTTEESQKLDEIPTENMVAYDFFLKGNYYWHTKTTMEGNLQAVSMYEEAIKLDPGFGLAYARQSIAHSVLYQQVTWDPTEERKTSARNALDKALLLIPEHPETQFAQGIYYIWCLNDRDAAIESFEKAYVGQPKNEEITNHLGQLYAESGNWEKAKIYFERAYELNPDVLGSALWLGGINDVLRNYVLAEKYYRESIAKFPENAVAYRFYADLKRNGFGDLEGARQVLKEGVMSTNRPDLLASSQILSEIYSRDFQQALEVIKTDYEGDFPSYYRALTYYYMGNKDSLSVELMKAKTELESLLALQPDSPIVLGRMGYVFALNGMAEEALAWVNKSIELEPVSKQALNGPNHVYRRAIIHAILGNQEEAIDDLEYVLSIPCGYTHWSLRHEPMFDSLREHPRFQKLIMQNV